MITIEDQIKSFQANYLPMQAQFWAYQSVLDMIENHKSHIDLTDAKIEATTLVEYFSCYGIEVDPETRFNYGRFSALQYINKITTPDMDLDKLVYWMIVASELSKLNFKTK